MGGEGLEKEGEAYLMLMVKWGVRHGYYKRIRKVTIKRAISVCWMIIVVVIIVTKILITIMGIILITRRVEIIIIMM